MEFPEKLTDINSIVPEPQYERKPKKKPKTVVIACELEQIHEIENTLDSTHRPLDSKKLRSEKLLPPVNLTIGAKVLPWRCRA